MAGKLRQSQLLNPAMARHLTEVARTKMLLGRGEDSSLCLVTLIGDFLARFSKDERQRKLRTAVKSKLESE